MKQKNKNTADSARERLLEAAMDVFGRYGYEGATTRMIATTAGVNIASIPYYFKGKEGLYKALINQIVEIIRSQVVEVQQEISRTDFSGESGRQKVQGLIEKLLENIIMFMVGSPEAPRISRIILREQLYPSAAYELIFKGFMDAILHSLADLLLVLSPEQTKRTALFKAMALMGQIVIFRVGRETMVRALDLEGYNAGELEEIRQVILAHTRTTLAALQ